MKKLSNEVKVGAIALITIVAFIWLYNYLKGKNLFSSTATYYSIYKDVGGLTESNPVEISGFKAGVVQSIDLINDKSGRLLVKLSINKNYILPENTVAEITTASLIAGMKVKLIFGDGPKACESGDTIPGRLAVSIITQFQNELAPMKEKIAGMINELDSVLTGLSDILSPGFINDFRGSMSNLNNTTRNLNEIIGSKEPEIKSIISDLSAFSGMLAENSAKFGDTVENLKTISDTLAVADLYSTVMNLKATLEKTSLIMGKMNNGEGTAGQLLTNDTLYKNLASSIESLDLLLKDLKANPKRYVHFSIFGKKNQPVK